MNKRLGQHFLVNKEKINKIVEVLEIKDGDTIIEIGPGHGELTHELRIKNKELGIIAVEKDEKLYEKLVNSNWKLGGVEFINGDALKILPTLITNYKLLITNYKIVGNIPYYITGRLLRILSELKNKPEIIVLTVQKEVAERICAKPKKGRSAPNSNGMNLLAASVQFWADPEIVGFISKNDFQPKPKVDSAIIKLTTKPTTHNQLQITNYYKLIKVLFKQPRKTILNNLKEFYPKEIILEKLNELNISPAARPQNLSIDSINKLSQML